MLCCIFSACIAHFLIKNLENNAIMLAYCMIILLTYCARNYASINGTAYLEREFFADFEVLWTNSENFLLEKPVFRPPCIAFANLQHQDSQ